MARNVSQPPNTAASSSFTPTGTVASTTVQTAIAEVASEAATNAYGAQTLTDAASVAWNAALGVSAVVTLGGNRTLANPTNATAGQRLTLVVVQDGTGGRTLAFDTAFAFKYGLAPVLDKSAAGRTILEFVYDGTKFNCLQYSLPSCQLTHTANQSVNSGSFTIMTFDTETWDNGNFHAAGAPTKLVAPFAGKYRVRSQIHIASNATNDRTLSIIRSTGSVAIGQVSDGGTPNGQPTRMEASCTVILAALEEIEMGLYQQSGGALNVVAQAGSPIFTIELLES